MFTIRRKPGFLRTRMFTLAAVAAGGLVLTHSSVAKAEGALARNCRASFMPSVTRSMRASWARQNADRKMRALNIMRRAGAWKLGQNLALAIIGKAGQTNPTATAKFERDAKKMAKLLRTKLPTMPAFRGEKIKRFVAGIHYLLRDAGPKIGSDLAAFGPEHPEIFELAVKSSLLGLLNTNTGKRETTLALCDAIDRSGKKSGISSKQWKPVVDAARGKKSPTQVRRAVSGALIDIGKDLKTESDQAYQAAFKK